MGLFSAIFGPKVRLLRDHTTRVSRSIRKRAAESIDGMTKAVDAIGALPGLADMAQSKKLPRGFSEQVELLLAHYDRYADAARRAMGLTDAPRAGTPEGRACCLEAPMGVSGPEALLIYRHTRSWPDFPVVAQQLGQSAEAQMKEIQSRHRGKDPERIRLAGRAVQEGRRAFAARGEPCPFLDLGKGRCRIWDVRPVVCRMTQIAGDPALADPGHPDHARARAHNIRLPLRPQIGLRQVDKRMGLGLSPFLWVAVLQLLQLADGELLHEAGEAPRRMQQDGRVAQRANRNVRHAKKFKKGKGKKRR